MTHKKSTFTKRALVTGAVVGTVLGGGSLAFAAYGFLVTPKTQRTLDVSGLETALQNANQSVANLKSALTQNQTNYDSNMKAAQSQLATANSNIADQNGVIDTAAGIVDDAKDDIDAAQSVETVDANIVIPANDVDTTKAPTATSEVTTPTDDK